VRGAERGWNGRNADGSNGGWFVPARSSLALTPPRPAAAGNYFAFNRYRDLEFKRQAREKTRGEKGREDRERERETGVAAAFSARARARAPAEARFLRVSLGNGRWRMGVAAAATGGGVERFAEAICPRREIMRRDSR